MPKYMVNITTYHVVTVDDINADAAEHQARNIQEADLPDYLDREYDVIPLDEDEEPIYTVA